MLINCCLVLWKWLPFIQMIYRQRTGICGFWNIALEQTLISTLNFYSALVKLGNQELWRFTLGMFLLQGQSGPSGGKAVPPRPAKAVSKKRVRSTNPWVLKDVFYFFICEMQTRFSLNNGLFYRIGNIPIDLAVRGCSRFPLRRELH